MVRPSYHTMLPASLRDAPRVATYAGKYRHSVKRGLYGSFHAYEKNGTAISDVSRREIRRAAHCREITTRPRAWALSPRFALRHRNDNTRFSQRCRVQIWLFVILLQRRPSNSYRRSPHFSRKEVFLLMSTISDEVRSGQSQRWALKAICDLNSVVTTGFSDEDFRYANSNSGLTSWRWDTRAHMARPFQNDNIDSLHGVSTRRRNYSV